MPTILDDQLDLLAPNVTIQVATPPPYDSSTVVFTETIPNNIFNLVDVASKKRDTVARDKTRDLAYEALNSDPPKYFVKRYTNAGKTVTTTGTSTTTTTTAPPLAPPLPPGEVLPDLPPEFIIVKDSLGNRFVQRNPKYLPFDEIEYKLSDLLGVVPPPSPPAPPSPSPPPPSPPGSSPPPSQAWTPLEFSSLGIFRDTPSAIYIDPIKSYISTPYFAPKADRHRNGTLYDPGKNVNPEDTVYLWQQVFKNETSAVVIDPTVDGSIVVQTQHRNSSDPANVVYLDPGKWEKKHKIQNGTSINAFTLIVALEGGAGESRSQASLWNFTMEFGDVTLNFFENSSEVAIEILGPNEPLKIALKPTDHPKFVDLYGSKPFILTFIPVLNGFLLSDGLPNSSDWKETITFIPDIPDLDVNNLISQALTPKQTRASKDKISKAEADQKKNPLPPKVEIIRKGGRYREPGIKLIGETKKRHGIRFGTRLTLTFKHCGGVLKFVPLLFPQFSRYHFLYPGYADIQDLPPPTDPPKRKKKKDKTPTTTTTPPPDLNKLEFDSTNPFNLSSKTNAIILPVFSYGLNTLIDFRTNFYTLVKSRSKPFAGISMEFKSVNPDVRLPIQVFGGMIFDQTSITESLSVVPPLNAEGTLTVDDLPQNRILRVSVSRALDGTSGEILWDRNDPIRGLLPRPPQNIGAVRIAVTGGANTVPGVIFTGIAYGNSQEDMPEENHIRIPLRGRESKLDSDGGVVLINAPYFDGFDHRDAMTFLANYGGVSIDTSLATPFRLISSVDINNPILDFPMGTGVSQAMDTITKESGSLFFFDRLGTLIHIDAETSTGVNWTYPDAIIETFGDEPDYSWVRNEIIIYALVAAPGRGQSINTDASQIPTQIFMVRVPISTFPEFPWSKQAVYTIPQIVRDQNELTRLATRIAKGISRPRATARCKLPANANIELLDTLNNDWIITSISYDADTQTKRWEMNVGVELFAVDVQNVGTPVRLPLSDLS